MATATRALTVRVPIALYQQGTALAKRRHLSMNALIQQALGALIKEEESRKLYEAFGRLGDDVDETDVEFAAQAQWEMVGHGESRGVARSGG